MHVLDQWLNYVDTEEILPLFEKPSIDYDIPKLDSIEWADHPAKVVAVVRDKDFSHIRSLDSILELRTILDLFNHHDGKKMLRDAYCHMLDLEVYASSPLDSALVAWTLLEYLLEAVYLIPTYLQSEMWKAHESELGEALIRLAPTLLRRLILLSNELGGFIDHSLSILLQKLKHIPLQDFSELIELSSLVVRSPEAALDLFLGILEPEIPRLLVGRPAAIEQFKSSLFGIALDHIDEACNSEKKESQLLRLSEDCQKDGYMVVKSLIRIDSSMSGVLKVGDHIRLTVSNPPNNAPIAKPFSMDAVVLSATSDQATFRCLHRPPTYFEQCAWDFTHCGSFVTSKTSFDAVTTFYTEREACCRIYGMLLGLGTTQQIELPCVELPVTPVPSLNMSQNAALMAAMRHSLTFIWGPPGTGKTHTVVMIMNQLLGALPRSRFLITAPTHNAVDNLMRRFLGQSASKNIGTVPVRVSTQASGHIRPLRKIAMMT